MALDCTREYFKEIREVRTIHIFLEFSEMFNEFINNCNIRKIENKCMKSMYNKCANTAELNFTLIFFRK